MAKETRPKDYSKLKNYQLTRFMLPTSHYDKKKADRAVVFIENLCHTKGKWSGTRFWLLPWQEQLIRDIFGIVKADGNRQFRTAVVGSTTHRIIFRDEIYDITNVDHMNFRKKCLKFSCRKVRR